MKAEDIEKLTLAQKINKIMENVPNTPKDLKVEMGGGRSYKAISHEAITKAVTPLLIKYRVTVLPSVVKATCTPERYIDNYGKSKLQVFTEIELDVLFINADDKEDTYIVKGYGQAIDNQDKGAGQAQSYAIKYVYSKVFNIATGEDTDGHNVDTTRSPQEAPQGKKPDKVDKGREITEKARDKQPDETDAPFDDVAYSILFGLIKACESQESLTDLYNGNIGVINDLPEQEKKDLIKEFARVKGELT